MPMKNEPGHLGTTARVWMQGGRVRPSLMCVVSDLRFALRSLVRSPGFALAVVLSLGLGLALTTATLSVANAFLVRSLPFPALDRLYNVAYAASGQPEPRGLTALNWSQLSSIIEVADSSAPTRLFVGEGAYLEDAAGLIAAPQALENVGVTPLIGRGFKPADFAPTSEPVALLGYGFWRTRHSADPAVIGQLLRARLGNEMPEAVPFRIIGVLPQGFRYVRGYDRDEIEIVVPQRGPMRTYLVRLREGVPPDVAAQRITEVVKATGTQFPPGWTAVELKSVHESCVGEVRPVLALLAVAVGFVLLLVWANVAVLTLLRATRRHKELALRLAIGAGRWHILRMLMAEMAVICGASLGLALATSALLLGALAPWIEQQLGRPIPGGEAALRIDSMVFLAVAAVTILIVLSLSFVPFLTLRSSRLGDALRSDARAGVDRPAIRWMRAALVATEVAVSVALLVGGGLMIRSIVNLLTTDLGILTSGVVRFTFVFPARGFPASALQFEEQLLARLASVPNSSIALTGFPLLTRPNPLALETDPAHARGRVGVLAVSEGFFDAVGVRVMEGRAFASTDGATGEPVAIVSASLKRLLWPDSPAVGQRIRLSDPSAQPGAAPPSWRLVVGVASDVRQSQRDDDLNDVYVPFAQAPTRFTSLYVRSDLPPSFWLDALRDGVQAIDADVRLGPPQMVDSRVDEHLAGARQLTSLLSGFAAFGALLALLGVYGATAYAVQQRQSEVAIRMALGATRWGVLQLFLKDGIVVLLVGTVSGIGGAVFIGRLLEQQLHGVRPLDAATIGATCAVITVCALAATWWPARRAASADPAAVLKVS